MTQYVMKGLEPAVPSCDILVIEDEPLVTALLMRYLSHLPKTQFYKNLEPAPQSFNIQSLDTGWDLLQADLSRVKVVVVDILLPQVTGVDLIRDFRKRFPGLGIVPISGMATEPMKRSLREALPSEMQLLPKPIRKDEFFEAFVKAWNFQNSLSHQNQQPHQAQAPEEVGEELWTAVQAKNNAVVPAVERRGLTRRKASA